MNDKAIQSIINNIDDPQLRAQLSNIAGGNIIKNVFCTKCKKVIANIYHDGQIIEIKNSE